MRTYLRQRRQLLWWLTALALFFAAYIALRTDRTAMNRLCGSVIFPAMRQVARLCDGFDGSVGEVLILTASWAGSIWLACTVRRLIAGPRRCAVLADFVLTAAGSSCPLGRSILIPQLQSELLWAIQDR